ncbi:hypothetical protein K456DRAFT_1243735 [Colletotrichum gloeosporioides 23]|nr:hypothetical protein K456DRAFT_1243735 [Colletotrichum gloeosporioides 23]
MRSRVSEVVNSLTINHEVSRVAKTEPTQRHGRLKYTSFRAATYGYTHTSPTNEGSSACRQYMLSDPRFGAVILDSKRQSSRPERMNPRRRLTMALCGWLEPRGTTANRQSFPWTRARAQIPKITHGPWFFFSLKRRGGGRTAPAPKGGANGGGRMCPGRRSGRERQLCIRRRGPFGRTTPRGFLDGVRWSRRFRKSQNSKDVDESWGRSFFFLKSDGHRSVNCFLENLALGR